MTWKERIKSAEHRGWFTDKDIEDSAQWDCCAVSEHGAIQHMSDRMWELGGQFYHFVKNDQIKEAAKVYRAIQREAKK